MLFLQMSSQTCWICKLLPTNPTQKCPLIQPSFIARLPSMELPLVVVHVGRTPEQRVAEGTDEAPVGSDVFLRWVVLAVVHVELFQRRKLRVAHTTGEGRFPILKKKHRND